MILEVSNTKTILEVQNKFSTNYPFLKIEFYDKSSNLAEHQVNGNKKIGEINKRHKTGTIEIHPWYKTGDIEQAFKKQYGLTVQIFRLVGEGWIETTGTDELTLEEQNEIGKKTTETLLHKTEGWIEREKLL